MAQVRVLGHLLGAAAVGVLLVVLAIPALAHREAAPVAPQKTTIPASLDMPPGRIHDAGVRALPLAPSGGLVAQRFPDGRGFEDVDRVRAALYELAVQLGLESVITRLLETWPGKGRSYPYEYGPHDRLIRGALHPNLNAADRRAAVDAATLTVVLAVHASVDEPDQYAATIGYSLLRAVRKSGNTCDVQINIAYLVAIGSAPNLDNVRLEVQRAEKLCPDDPTPPWLWAKFLSTQETVIGEDREVSGAPAEYRRLAEAAFADLRTRFADLPMGYAGAADLYLDWADSAEGVGGKPFQVRAWRQRAAELYAQARQRSDDPRLTAGHARVLSDLQQHDAAVDLINQAATHDPGDATIGVLRSTILGSAGRHGEAAAAIVAETLQQPWWGGREPLGAISLPDYYASEEYPQLIVSDQNWAPCVCGGGSVDDISFVPRSRGFRADPSCRSLVAMEEWLLAGQPDRVYQLIAKSRGTDLPEHCSYRTDESDGTAEMTALAHLATGSWSDFESVVVRGADSDEHVHERRTNLLDAWQDLLRSAGQLDAARIAATAWSEREPESGLAKQRLGEVNYLLGNLDDAADQFSSASKQCARQAIADPYDSDFFGISWSECAIWALVQRAGTLQRLDRHDNAEQVLRKAADDAAKPQVRDAGTPNVTDYLAMHTHSQLGILEMRRQHWAAAAKRFRKAIRIGQTHDRNIDGPDGPISGQKRMLQGAQENNLALAYVKLGRAEKAIPIAIKAHLRDPASPIFLDTVAFALHAAGRTNQAIPHYREALMVDSTSYVSANNLAVLLADGGNQAEAREVLEMAVRANPDYALGWHNLGILWGHERSPAGYLRSQGAFGRAALLDPGLRGADPTLRVDRLIYETGVDISRPIPPGWTYAATASPPRTRWTATLIALLLLRIGYGLVAHLVGDRLSGRILAAEPGVRPAWWRRSLPAVLAGGLAALILVGRGPLLEPNAANLILAVTMITLVAAPIAIRWWSTQRAKQYSTPLVMAAGVVGAAVGLAFAPFPSVRGPRLLPFAYLIVPVVLLAIGAVSVVSVLITGVPLARMSALACLTLLSSIFVAIPPMDGAQIKGRLINIGITVLLMAGVAAFAVPLL